MGALGAILERPFEQFNFGSIFLSILVAKRVPKGRHLGTQNGAQDDPKSIKKSSQKTIAFGIALKTVLGRSWADLGRILGALGGQNRAVAHTALVFSKIDLFEEKWCQDASWDDLGSIWVAKRGRLGGPKGTQEASKTRPK